MVAVDTEAEAVVRALHGKHYRVVLATTIERPGGLQATDMARVRVRLAL